ncbi:MAG: M24 family metallopeptidase C-terminal domain-containing protein, partial [Bacteroidaceae bacterium]
LGPITEKQKKDYTLVLKGHIQLALCKFPEGSSGTQLDILARNAMWKEGINYLHGTGHGVGSFLNVHEGPHQIRMNYMPAPLLNHMTVTNEPGIYKAGEYGCRTENTMIIIPYCKGEFGPFLQFEPLTLCPIDTIPIKMEMMSEEEILWINDYHHTVFEKLSPLLQKDEVEWLKEATQTITK